MNIGSEGAKSGIVVSGGNFESLGVEKKGTTWLITWFNPEHENTELLLFGKGETIPGEVVSLKNANTQGALSSAVLQKVPLGYTEYQFQTEERIFPDPFAKGFSGIHPYGEAAVADGEEEEIPAAYRKQGPKEKKERKACEVHSRLIRTAFDWQDAKKPQHDWKDVIAYQLHVRGFTKSKYSGVRKKGTFAGIIEKIPYFLDLGINQLQLMPVYEFEECPSGGSASRANRKLNFWGYKSGSYFAPKASYASKDPTVEMREMVRELHKNGIEVILDFYFPTTVSVGLVTQILSYWSTFYQVDGFHLIGRTDLSDLIAKEPTLCGVKLVAGSCPVQTLDPNETVIMGSFNPNMAEMNDGFAMDIRRFLKGDEYTTGGFKYRTTRYPKENGLINFISRHDGFTLMDLVSYNEKHNEENGENNRDGADWNASWNCGEEGETKKRSIRMLRKKQIRNALSMLFLSAGTPLLRAGDEFCNSQGGNNNPYCLDNEISWVDWSAYRKNKEITLFVKELIEFRKNNRAFGRGDECSSGNNRLFGYPEISFHTNQAWYFNEAEDKRQIGIFYCFADEEGNPDYLYIAYNTFWDSQKFALPVLKKGYVWTVDWKTDADKILFEDRCALVPERSVCVLKGIKKPQEEEMTVSKKEVSQEA